MKEIGPDERQLLIEQNTDSGLSMFYKTEAASGGDMKKAFRAASEKRTNSEETARKKFQRQ